MVAPKALASFSTLDRLRTGSRMASLAKLCKERIEWRFTIEEDARYRLKALYDIRRMMKY